MKTIIITIALFTVWGAFSEAGAKEVPPPPTPNSSSSLPYEEQQKQLDGLLKSNQLSDFYQELLAFSLSIDTKGWNEASPEEQYGALLFCFYAAKAPLISFSYDKENLPPRTNTGISWDKSDITAKSWTVSRLLSLSYYKTTLFFSKKEDLAHLSAKYCAAVLKCFREFYDPKLEETLKLKMTEIDEKTIKQFRAKWKPWWKQTSERSKTNKNQPTLTEKEKKEEIEQWHSSEMNEYRTRMNLQSISVRMGFMERRNRDMPGLVESEEKEFLQMLVNYFPGKKGEVMKYIRMAGYKNDEINGLVDRTVGRDSKTEFLYKGRSKKDAR